MPLERKFAGESANTAVQRLMVLFSYLPSSTGAFAVDGDFGPGTNRGVAQCRVQNGQGGNVS